MHTSILTVGPSCMGTYYVPGACKRLAQGTQWLSELTVAMVFLKGDLGGTHATLFLRAWLASRKNGIQLASYNIVCGRENMV